MNTILILTSLVFAAALVTAIFNWPRGNKPKTHEIDSAQLIRALKGGN